MNGSSWPKLFLLTALNANHANGTLARRSSYEPNLACPIASPIDCPSLDQNPGFFGLGSFLSLSLTDTSLAAERRLQPGPNSGDWQARSSCFPACKPLPLLSCGRRSNTLCRMTLALDTRPSYCIPCSARSYPGPVRDWIIG